MNRRLLVIGNGMCSLRLLEELTVVAAGKFEITVIGAEPSPAYNRVLLSPMLAGELATGDVALKPASWYAQNAITLCTGQPVTQPRNRGSCRRSARRHPRTFRHLRSGHRVRAYTPSIAGQRS